jgi:hypothetical protein
MSQLLKACVGSVSAAALALSLAAPAKADQTVVVAGSTPAPAAEPAAGWPNGYMLHSGVFTFGASYIPALVVAIESNNSADNHLYAPVVGPWLDLADRGRCYGQCGHETVNKVLLVTDGVFQGLGVLQIVGSLLMPTTHAVAVSRADGAPAVSIHVTPAMIGNGGNGLVALGEF